MKYSKKYSILTDWYSYKIISDESIGEYSILTDWYSYKNISE